MVEVDSSQLPLPHLDTETCVGASVPGVVGLWDCGEVLDASGRSGLTPTVGRCESSVFGHCFERRTKNPLFLYRR